MIAPFCADVTLLPLGAVDAAGISAVAASNSYEAPLFSIERRWSGPR